MKIHGLEFKTSPKFSTSHQKEQETLTERTERRGVMKSSNLILVGIIVVLAVALGYVLVGDKFDLPWLEKDIISPLEEKAEPKKSGYQAVFLTNGQVYFGKLSGFPGSHPILKNVYYLRAQRSLQPSESPEEEEIEVESKDKEKKTTASPTPAAQPALTLIKLGNELHGPMDQIKLNSEHILFVEDLKEDSRIVKAIAEFQFRQ